MKSIATICLTLLSAMSLCADEPASTVVLEAATAKIEAGGGGARYESKSDRHCVGYWGPNTNTVVNWQFELKERATYRVIVVYSALCPPPGPELEAMVGQQRAGGFAKPTGDWSRFEELDLGPVLLRKPGKVDVAVKVTRSSGGQGVNLRTVKLVKEP